MKKTLFILITITYILIEVTVIAQTPHKNTNSNITILKNDSTLPLFVIDGIKMPIGYEMDLSPHDIKHITVLKGVNAKESYGEIAKNGVIEIVTKSKEEKFFNKNKLLFTKEKPDLISVNYNKRLETSTFEKKYKVEVDEELTTLDISLYGNISKGMVEISVTSPKNKQIVPLTKMDYKGAIIDKNIKLNKNDVKGTWIIKVITKNATGQYKIKFQMY